MVEAKLGARNLVRKDMVQYKDELNPPEIQIKSSEACVFCQYENLSAPAVRSSIGCSM